MSSSNPSDLFRRLPAVDEVLKDAAVAALLQDHGRASVVWAVRAELDELRAGLASGRLGAPALAGRLEALAGRVAARTVAAVSGTLRRVVNASGVVIHTNLGRVPLSKPAAEKLLACATGYSNLEYDLEQGERGRRDDHAGHLLSRLFARQGIEAMESVVVNNNAAAVFLALAGLARGGEVIVSRGELVEIGGSFRIPDIMAESGASLREVGTTNRTRIADYERAITENTRLLLRVHRSNFEILGFTERPELSELVALGRARGILVMEDLGSGAMTDLGAFGIGGEPGLCQSLAAGVDIVTCSGDKLLGGPQAGLISGRADLVQALRRHPLFRALRVDKLCYAALEATLSSYLRERYDEIPLLAMLAVPAEAIERRCRALAGAVRGADVEIVATRAMIGGGAAPGKSVPSFALALAPATGGADELARRLRLLALPVVTRIEDGRVLIDLRTVDEADDPYLAKTLHALA